MAEREGLTATGEAPVRRNADEIRMDIVAERQVIAETVDQLGVRIQEKLEWRSYVNRSPYVALGIAAGVGLVAAGLFKKQTPLERLINSSTKPLSKARRKSLFKTILFSVTTTAAKGWLENAVSEAVARSSAERSSKQPGSM